MSKPTALAKIYNIFRNSLIMSEKSCKRLPPGFDSKPSTHSRPLEIRRCPRPIAG